MQYVEGIVRLYEEKIDQNPTVKAALERRRQILRELKARWAAPEKGLIKPELVEDDDYFYRIASRDVDKTLFYGVMKTLKMGLKWDDQRAVLDNQSFVANYVIGEYRFLYENFFREYLMELIKEFSDTADITKKVQEEFLETIKAGTYKELLAYFRAKFEAEADALGINHFRKSLPNMSDDPLVNREQWISQRVEKAIEREINLMHKDKFKDYVRQKYPDYGFHDLGKTRRVVQGYVLKEAKIAEMLKATAQGEGVTLTQEDISPRGIIAGPHQEILIHTDFIKAIQWYERELNKNYGSLFKILFAINTWTKKILLLMPTRFLSWMMSNFFGDFDAVLGLQPGIVLRKQFSKDMKHSFYIARHYMNHEERAKMSPEDIELIESAIKNRVINAGLFVKEMEDITEHTLDHLLSISGGKASSFVKNMFKQALKDPLSIPVGTVNKYLATVGRWANIREDVLRLTAYKYYLSRLNEIMEQIRQSYPNTPLHELPDSALKKIPLGGSRRAEIFGLIRGGVPTNLVAAKLSAELVGDYGGVSYINQQIARYVIPFHRFQAVNMYRYVNLFHNVWTGSKIDSPALGKAVLFTAWRGFVTTLKIHLWLGFIAMLNMLFFGKEFDDLQESQISKGRLPLIIGTTDDGKISILRMEGSLSNLLRWVGLELGLFTFLSSGQLSPEEMAKGVVKAPLNQALQGVLPFAKTIIESATGRSWFPDVYNPRPIRDPGEHLSRALALDSVWNLAIGKPTITLSQVLWGLGGVSFIDPYEAMYFESKRISQRFSENLGITKPETIPSGRGNYLYYFKKALQVGDKDAALNYLTSYIENGGDFNAVIDSIKKEHPLASVPVKYRKLFMDSLSERDKRVIKRALEWYQKIYFGEPKISPADLREIARSAWATGRPKFVEKVQEVQKMAEENRQY
jgi:hypothetical protein